MDLSVLASLAVEIVIKAINTATDGALEKVGADLLDFLKTRFQDRLQIEEAREEPKILEAAILSEAKSDKTFRKDLERLVTQYQHIQKTSNVSQNTESGVNLNVDSNTGTVIGQQIRQQQFFR